MIKKVESIRFSQQKNKAAGTTPQPFLIKSQHNYNAMPQLEFGLLPISKTSFPPLSSSLAGNLKELSG
jgi:hypothetical protein